MSVDTAVAPARPVTRWLPVLALALGTFGVGTDSLLVAGVLSGTARDLHVTEATAGQFVTVYSIAYAVGAPIMMAALRVRSPRRLLLGAIIGFVAVNVLAAVAQGPVTMLVARVLAGCLGGVYSPLAAATAAGLVPANMRARALAIVLGGTSVATLAGVPIGVWLARQSSWRTAFVFVAVLAVVATIGIALSVRTAGPVAAIPLRARVAPLRRPAVLLALAVTVAGLGGGFVVYTYVEPLFAAQPGVGRDAVGLLIMLQGLGALGGLWLGGTLVDRFSARPVLLGCFVVFTANMALLSLSAHSLVTAGLFMVVWGIVGWAFVPAQQHSMIADAPPELAPILLSLNGSAMYVGIAAGSAVGGAVTAGLGADHLWIFAAAFAATGLLLTLIRHGRRR